MALYGRAVEYGLHCLLLLARMPAAEPSTSRQPPSRRPSVRDLAEFQGVSPSYLAKIFTQLEKSGLVRSVEGVGGGFELARPAEAISVHDVADALEPGKRLFDCQNVRRRCVLYEGRPPIWATAGMCGIHAAMLQAEREMQRSLQAVTLADLAAGLAPKVPPAFEKRSQVWFVERARRRQPGGRRADRSTSAGDRSG